ncbi:unnamed protein product [Phytomonas sp. Hart1]|nr:unnamed protein product [Phytomonas sp. Hart1]|eukprot:CCW69507.1 unnamed protein product [Phytomonas sp. isolate Hart1]
MGGSDAVDPNSTFMRRGRRHPNLLATMTLPLNITEQLKSARHKLGNIVDLSPPMASTSTGGLNPGLEKIQKNLSVIAEALDTFLTTVNTPDSQLKAISRITSRVRESLSVPINVPASSVAACNLKSCMNILTEEFAIPLLLDSRVRYLHRALTTLLRQTCVFDDAALQKFEEIFIRMIVKSWKEDPTTNLPSIFSSSCQVETIGSSTAILASKMKASKQDVMFFLNTIDCLSSTLMPMAPRVFEHTFLEILSLLADCLCWCVNNAIQQRRLITLPPGEMEEPHTNYHSNHTNNSNNSNNMDKGAVFDEDLDSVRFCVRMVATYTHRYLPDLHTLLRRSRLRKADQPCEVRQCVLEDFFTRLLRPVFLMLTSTLFPKDVLNAGGLLLASMVTVGECDPSHIHAVCRLVCAEVEENIISATELWALPQDVFSLVYTLHSSLALLSEANERIRTFQRLFDSFTNNGRFAFLKGLLAHLSRPVYDRPITIGVLLRPLGPLHADRPQNTHENSKSDANKEDEKREVIAYDIIVPFAERFSSAIQEPETRFMAIQTMDSVVRHAAACFSFISNWLRTQSDDIPKHRDSKFNQETLTMDSTFHQRKKERREKDLSTPINSDSFLKGSTPYEDRENIFSLFYACSLFPVKLECTLYNITQLIMGLWDDGTQSMSGVLYETYDQVLLAKQQFRSIRVIFHPPSLSSPQRKDENGENVAEMLTDSMETLLRVLAIQSERRARYHALLGLFSVIPLQQILQGLDLFFIKNTDGDSTFAAIGMPLSLAHEPALVCFSKSLLSGASNHKVGNVCGDVFVKLARLLNPKSSESCHANAHLEPFLLNISDLFHKGLIYPLSRAIAEVGYVRVIANVSESVNISNIVSHFVVPLFKQLSGAFPALIHALLAFHKTSGAKRERVYQGVVEVLYRARDLGLDISVFMAPLSETFRIVEASLQAWSFDLRNTAFRLCVFAPKRVAPIEAWQCKVVEAFLSLNMHLGGDTTARKGLLDSYRKWTVQISESFKRGTQRTSTSSRGNLCNKTAESDLKGVDEAYRQMLVNHCISCVRLFAEHYGLTIEHSQGLSIERRTAAASCYVILLTELMSLIKGHDSPSSWQPSLRECFPSSIVKPLLADLSDGWALARKCAKKVLLLYFQHAFPIVQEVVNPASILKSSISELRGSFTYRNAEGAVLRFMLFDSQTPEAYEAAAADPEKDFKKRLDNFLKEVSTLDSMCKDIQTIRENGMDVEVCAFVRQNPLHGRLSLCMAILTSVFSRFRTSLDGKATRASNLSILREASNEFLKCSLGVLRTCRTLVGSEPLMWSALGRPEAKKEGISFANSTGTTPSVVVDCRGHVYDPHQRPEAEGLMRIVANNTWLAIRSVTLAVPLITVELHKLEELNFEVVRTICFDLVDTLLSTKHNGVMRCVQDALRMLMKALLRCRLPLFYSLPSEMADYLMGEDGVMSSDASRMLRRSQGLPHAILSILGAEDGSLPCFIFPSVLSRLLALVREGLQAEGDAIEVAKTSTEVQLSQRSNSLNVLKFIFDDKTLAERAIPYLEEVFLLASEGFSDPNWGIQNSSLMLFSSVLQRFVGEHPSTGGVGVNTSLHDITRRTPRAVSFALRILTQRSTSSVVSLTDAPTLNIFPVLQMLSMLSPDPSNLLNDSQTSFPAPNGAESAGQDATPVLAGKNLTDRIVNAVMGCGANRCLAARTASARALVCIVPCADIPANLRVVAFRHFDPKVAISNSLHGGLLQLQRFHLHYVGSLAYPPRQGRLSSRATPALAMEVTRTLTDILRSHEKVLKEGSIICPAIAAACVELISDLVYFGPHNGLPREILMSLLAWAMPILERNICAPIPVYERAKAYHGGVRRAGALCLLLAVRFLHLHSSEPGDSECEETIRRSIRCVLAHEVRTLDLASGLHNVTSLLLSHMHFYTTERRLFPKGELMGIITKVLKVTYAVDLPSASLQALTNVLKQHRSGYALGCVAWEEVMAHLEFTVSLQRRRYPLEMDRTLDTDYQIIQECVLALLDSDFPDSEIETWLHPPEFCGTALRFLVCRSLQTERVLPGKITKILSSFAGAESPLMARKAVLEALSDCFEVFSTRKTQQYQSEDDIFVAIVEPESKILHDIEPLLLILVRLLCDDTAEVRYAACTVCPLVLHACSGSDLTKVDAASHFFVQDQASSLLSIVLVLRQLLREKKVSILEMETYFLSNLSPNLSLPELPCEAEALVEGLEVIEADNDDIGDDILFQKEPDNIFMERITLDYIIERLQDALHFPTTPVHSECAQYNSYNELLSSAESEKSLQVRIIPPNDR